MFVKLKYLTILLAMTVSGCTSTQKDEDPDMLCQEISLFVASVNDLQKHEVILINKWGGPYLEDENSIGEKNCIHNGDEAAKKFCDYLLGHTSTEFPAINFNRTAECLNQPSHKSSSIYGDSIHGKKKISKFFPGSNVILYVSYYDDEEFHAPVLKFTIKRKK